MKTRVLDLQRTVGNRAVGRLVARADPDLRHLSRAARSPEAEWALTHPGLVEDTQEFLDFVPQKPEEDLDEYVLFNFLVDGAQVRKGHREDMDPVAERWAGELSADANLRIRVLGYASTSGSDEWNEELADRRAKSVRDYLVEKGIPADQIVIDSYGSGLPLMINQTPEGFARNRRVEVSKFFATTVGWSLADLAPGTSVTTVFDATVPSRYVANEGNDFDDFFIRFGPLKLQCDFVFTSSDPTLDLGIVQFVLDDLQLAIYTDDNGDGAPITADFYCVRDFLPVRDVELARGGFSRDSSKPFGGARPSDRQQTIFFESSAETHLPLHVPQGASPPALLTGVRWARRFATVLAARKGATLVPVKCVLWSFDTFTKVLFHDLEPTGHTSVAITMTPPLVSGSVQPGPPPELDIERAMSMPTVEFRQHMQRRLCEPAFPGPDDDELRTRWPGTPAVGDQLPLT